jgi:ferritin-like metal-binding protein YciE
MAYIFYVRAIGLLLSFRCDALFIFFFFVQHRVAVYPDTEIAEVEGSLTFTFCNPIHQISKNLNRHNFSGSKKNKNNFMENMNQLRDLLKHEIKDLYSAEEQIIDALPKMIDKATNKDLKQALQQHLEVTEKQKGRLDDVLEALNEEREEEGEGALGLFKGEQKCLAMEGIIKEGEKLMKEDMSSEVSDAAIIAAAQKIEHYEISSYGTVRTYAQELNLDEVADMLKETLDEEYEADDLLT